jgi:hypothetical protein
MTHPAKSTRFISELLVISLPLASFLICSKITVTTVWARLLVAFICVAATVRLEVPIEMNEEAEVNISTTDETSSWVGIRDNTEAGREQTTETGQGRVEIVQIADLDPFF